VFCINRDNGAIRWSREVDEGNQTYRKQNNASPSPVTDGAHVWVYTGNGVLVCFDRDGKEVWRRNLQDDYGPFGLNWGYASSPLLHEDRLVIPVLHGMRTDAPSYVVALDKRTGRELWRTERPTDAPAESPDAYVTPQLLKLGDSVEVVLNGGDLVTGHDIQTGREVWRADVLNPGKAGNYRIVPSCLIVGELIIAPSRVNPMVAIRTGGKGDVSKTHVVWTSPNGPDVPTPVSDGRHLWLVTGDRSLFSCLDVRTGEPFYDRERLPNGTYSSSPILADGKIYLTNESTETVVIAAAPEFRIVATNKLPGSNFLSTPAIVGRQIFLRTSEALYCIEQPAGRAARGG
jgi:outer membrane protein assembly factor BamB